MVSKYFLDNARNNIRVDTNLLLDILVNEILSLKVSLKKLTLGECHTGMCYIRLTNVQYRKIAFSNLNVVVLTLILQ
jgi:hypothetical protein